jgi:Fe2+ transport system protein FeoA
MSLSDIDRGKIVMVIGIAGGKAVRQKLLGLGMIPGVHVKVLQRSDHSPMVLSVLDNQVMLGRGMADKVLVK